VQKSEGTSHLPGRTPEGGGRGRHAPSTRALPPTSRALLKSFAHDLPGSKIELLLSETEIPPGKIEIFLLLNHSWGISESVKEEMDQSAAKAIRADYWIGDAPQRKCLRKSTIKVLAQINVAGGGGGGGKKRAACLAWKRAFENHHRSWVVGTQLRI